MDITRSAIRMGSGTYELTLPHGAHVLAQQHTHGYLMKRGDGFTTWQEVRQSAGAGARCVAPPPPRGRA